MSKLDSIPDIHFSNSRSQSLGLEILPLTGEPGTGAIINFFVFLFVFVIPEIAAYFKLNRMANELEKG
jgi:hypothetical protein